jgi:hypothetical protein
MIYTTCHCSRQPRVVSCRPVSSRRLSVTVPLGFSPAGQASSLMRSEDVHFPMPSLQGEARPRGGANLPRWQRGAPRGLPNPDDMESEEDAGLPPRRPRR